MRRVRDNAKWSLFCPHEAPGLADVYGDEYDTLYEKYEADRRYKRQVDARTVWDAMITAQIETGQPYMLYKDSINKKSNQKNVGVIKSSNLCVTGDTLILTDRGQKAIKDLVDADEGVRVWNGEKFSRVTVEQTGTAQETVVVTTSTGARLQCTPYHKFYLEGHQEPVAASDLRPADALIEHTFPLVDNGKENRAAHDCGWHASSGPCKIQPPSKCTYEVPTTWWAVKSRIHWLDGLIDASGVVSRTEDLCAQEIRVHSKSVDFLRRVMCLIQTLGAGSIVTKEGLLLIPCGDVERLMDLGLKPRRLVLRESRAPDAKTRGDDLSRRPIVTSYKKAPGLHDTFCFDEPDRHMGVFNGILCGNCTEIVEFSSSDETAVCLTGDTEIITRHGLQRIDRINGDEVLAAFDDVPAGVLRKDDLVTAHLIDNGERDVYRVQIGGTRPIEATANHKFLVQSSRNYNTKRVTYVWRSVDELLPGDRVVVPDTSPLPDYGRVAIQKECDLHYLVAGWLIGKHKVIPEKLKYGLAPELQAAVLSGYFSADGSVYANSKHYVQLTSASEELLFDVQAMLRCFGIQSKVHFYYVKQRDRWQGRLVSHGVQNLVRFQKHINFMLCSDKRHQLEAALRTLTRTKQPTQREWCPVIEVTFVGTKRVYDLALPTAHTFLASGAVTHNCNLSSIALPRFVKDGEFDYQRLHDVTKVVTRNTNEVIDRTYYPIPQARRSNLRHRPIGLGVQGLADVFSMLRLPWDSSGAADVNVRIFATIYHAAVEASTEMAEEKGAYETFDGSPASQGLLQFDLWGVEPHPMWDWAALKERVKKWGMRNSLLVAPMPTASTAQVLGNTEAVEPVQAMLFKRNTISGEFIVVNKYLVKELLNRGLWNKNLKDRIVAADGSIQHIAEIDADIKSIYKTAWELKQRVLIDLAAARGPYVDQSQSLNLFMANAEPGKLRQMHFHAWKSQLKTGLYYLRSKAATGATKVTIDPSLERQASKKTMGHEDETCLSCSS